MTPRSTTVAALKSFGVVSIVLIVALGVWLLLAILGDRTAAAGARAVSSVTGVCWGLNLVALVVSTAWTQVSESEQPASTDRESTL